MSKQYDGNITHTCPTMPLPAPLFEHLMLKGKRPKTVDAYARAIEDLLAYFTTTDSERLLEADEADLDNYITSLKQRGVNPTIKLVKEYNYSGSFGLSFFSALLA